MKLMEVLDTAPSQKLHVTDSPNLKENKENTNNERLWVNHKAKLDTSNMQQPNHEARASIKIDGSRKTRNGNIARTKLNSPNVEETQENKSRNRSSNYQKGKVSRHKQDFDTIETDSGSHKEVMRRPITRSSTRKKAPPKTANNLQENTNYDKNPLASSGSDFKLKFDKKIIFSFDEIEVKSGSLSWIANGRSNRLKEKNDEQKKPKIEPTSPTLSSNEVLCGAQTSKYTQESKMHGSKGFDNSSPGSWQSDTNTEGTDATMDIHKSQDMESLHREEETEKQLSPSPMKRQSNKCNIDDRKGKDRAKIHKWFSNDTSLENRSPKNKSPKNKSPKSKNPKNKNPKNSLFNHHHTRRASGLNKTKTNRKSKPSSLCPNGTAKTVGSLDNLEQYPEDCLASSVTQLASVLRKFKAKLKTETLKESSKVLSAAANEVRLQLQLQGVESQISADVEKFVSVGKSKRKRLESELQEQQERLRLIQNKFKEEVNQHLVDCQRTLEKIEACHVELKGTAEQQKVSHGKLFVQVKQAVDAHISDSETKIAAIQKEANKKMNDLKRSLGE